MPKSKRNKVVSMSKVKSKGKEGKASLIEHIRESIEQYPRVFVFRFKNLRNVALKKLREEMNASSRFFLGSNKVMQVALGRDKTTAFRKNLESLSDRLKGFTGLLFTSLNKDEVEEMFSLHEEMDFARPGQKCNETVQLPEGPVMNFDGTPVAHTLEPKLRQNGMPTKLNHGVVELIAPYTLCKEGEELSPKQCSLLRTFNTKMAKFTLTLDSCFEAGNVEIISEPGDDFDDDDLGEEEKFGVTFL